MHIQTRTEVALQFAAQKIDKEEFIEQFFAIPETIVHFDDEREAYFDGPAGNTTATVMYEVSTKFGTDVAEHIANIVDAHEDGEIH